MPVGVYCAAAVSPKLLANRPCLKVSCGCCVVGAWVSPRLRYADRYEIASNRFIPLHLAGVNPLVLDDVAVAAEGPLRPCVLPCSILRTEPVFRRNGTYLGSTRFARSISGCRRCDLSHSDKEVEAVQLNKQFKKYQGIDRPCGWGQFLDADVVITGVVEKLGMRRMTVGNPIWPAINPTIQWSTSAKCS